MSAQAWDTVIRNALVFDGTGAPPQQVDIALRDGKIAARGSALPTELAAASHRQATRRQTSCLDR